MACVLRSLCLSSTAKKKLKGKDKITIKTNIEKKTSNNAMINNVTGELNVVCVSQQICRKQRQRGTLAPWTKQSVCVSGVKRLHSSVEKAFV